MKSTQKPHGTASIHWEGNILVLTPIGNFNMEGIHIFHQKMMDAVENRACDQWIRMDYVLEDGMGGDDVLAEVEAKIPWCFDHGCVRLVVICEGLRARIFEKKIPSLEIYSSKEAAMAALESDFKAS